MRIYYKEDGHYPGTYSFKDEEDDTSGTDIVWVDEAVVGANYTVKIIALEDGHKKVLELYDNDGAAQIILTHDFVSGQTSGTIEFWLQITDAANRVLFHGDNQDDANSVYIKIEADKFQYNDGIWNDVGLVALDNTWYHIKLIFDCTPDTYEIWIDGLQYQAAAGFQNVATTIDRIQIYTDAVDSGYYVYFDAFGYSWDTDYTVGDNLQDWDWMRVSAIIDFPDITTRNNIYGSCSVTLRDFEGGLYSTWQPRDLTEMIITDDTQNRAKDCNIIFRGILTNKRFHSKDLILDLSGIGIHLNRNSFGTDEEESYVLEEGFVVGTPALEHSSKLYLQDGDLVDFTGWENDYWTSNERDVGLLIKDTTAGYGTETWDAESITTTGDLFHITTAGNHVHTNGFDDGDKYIITWDVDNIRRNINKVYTTPVIEGVVIADSEYLKSIKIEWNYRLRCYNESYLTYTTVESYFQIYNNDTSKWEDIPGSNINFRREGSGTWTTQWCQAVSTANGGTGNEYILRGIDAELQHYFDKVGADYDHLSGFRLYMRFETDLSNVPSYVTIDLDFIQITPQYNADDVEPIMRKITGSGIDGDGSYVEVASVEFWDEMGLTVDEDAFQIGQNTQKIIQDVASDSGLNIDIICDYGNKEASAYLIPNGAGATNEWSANGGGATPHEPTDEYPDVDGDGWYLWADDGSIVPANAVSIFKMENLPNVVEVTEITVHCYIKKSAGTPAVNLTWDIDLDGWQGGKTTILADAYTWKSVTWAGLSGTQTDLDSLEVKVTGITPNADNFHYIETMYVEVTYQTPKLWSKYMARIFKGKHCIEPLKSVLLLEGAEWMEDYPNNRIKLAKKADFEDSGVTLDQTDYDHNWEFEDQCNQVKYVYVWGKTSIDSTTKTVSNIKASAVDPSVVGENSVQIIDDNIWTDVEAQEIADTQLALLKDKRPSIRIPLNGVQAALQMGTYVNITMARPTIGATDYKIRMISRRRRGKTGIETVIYAGFGETDWDEKIIKAIILSTRLAHKSLSDKLTSTPYNVGLGG